MSDTETEIQTFEEIEAFDQSEPQPEFEPGVYADIPEETYHRSKGVSKSRLAQFAKAPAKALVPVKETSSMRLGTAAHCALLEPDQFDARFLVCDLHRNTKAYKEIEAAAKAEGRTPIKTKERDAALGMRDAALAKPVLREILTSELLTEQSAYWQDRPTGLICRGRMDGIHLRFRAIVDIKTTTDASPYAFAKIASSFNYHWQQAMYNEGIIEAGGWEPEAFLFVAIERDKPYLPAIYEMDPEHVEVGGRQVRALLDRYAQCVKTDTWPGYSDAIERLSLLPRALLEAV